MTIAYHGTPLTPNDLLLSLRGRHFCVSYYRPDQIEFCDQAAQSLMLDNGAFSAWKANEKRQAKGLEPIVFDRAYWAGYHEFCRRWCARPTTWAVIPDVIDAGEQEQDALIREWPAELRDRAAPVWHMDERIDRLLRLIDEWPRVCIGSTAEYRIVKSPDWIGRMDEVWDQLAGRRRFTPWLHMLRGMQLLKPACPWPFASVDSTDLARNHNRLNRYSEQKVWALKQKADRWDQRQCPPEWAPRLRSSIFGEAA